MRVLLSFSVLALVLLFLSNCQNNESTQQVLASSPEVDSIRSWVQKARNTELSKSERYHWVTRAEARATNFDSDSLKAKLFSRISLAYYYLDDSLKFHQTNQKTKRFALNAKDSVSFAETHWDLGNYFSQIGLRDSAYFHYGEAQTVYEDIGEDYYNARLLRNMAQIQYEIKDYLGSEVSIVKAIGLLKPLNDPRKNLQLYRCYNVLAIAAKKLEAYDLALAYHDEAEIYLEKIENNNRLLAETYNNRGLVYFEQEKYKLASTHFAKTLAIDSLEIKHEDIYAKALNSLGYTRLKNNDHSDLPELFHRAKGMFEKIDNQQELSRSYFCLAEYQIAKKDTAEALTYLNTSKELALLSDNNERLLASLELLTKIDPSNATQHSQEYIQLNDSLLQAERQTRNMFARIQFETDEFIAENEVLVKQNQLWSGLAFGLLLLAGFIFIIIWQRIKNQKLRFERQQQKNNEEIFNLMLSQNQKLEEGKQEEQKRISEELHDGILGEMNGVRMVLLGLNSKVDEEAVHMRSSAIEKLQELQEEIRTISHELNDASHSKINNFVVSVQDMVSNICSPAQMTYDFECDEGIIWDNLSGETKINIFRIIQESLMNCVKHAQATYVDIKFGHIDKTFSVSIEDNGLGFDTHKLKKGIGLKNIQSRIEKLNGSWSVQSDPGKGTLLQFEVPSNDLLSVISEKLETNMMN